MSEKLSKYMLRFVTIIFIFIIIYFMSAIIIFLPMSINKNIEYVVVNDKVSYNLKQYYLGCHECYLIYRKERKTSDSGVSENEFVVLRSRGIIYDIYENNGGLVVVVPKGAGELRSNYNIQLEYKND